MRRRDIVNCYSHTKQCAICCCCSSLFYVYSAFYPFFPNCLSKWYNQKVGGCVAVCVVYTVDYNIMHAVNVHLWAFSSFQWNISESFVVWPVNAIFTISLHPPSIFTSKCNYNHNWSSLWMELVGAKLYSRLWFIVTANANRNRNCHKLLLHHINVYI